MKRNPIFKVDSGSWAHLLKNHRIVRLKSWGFECPGCGQVFARPKYGQPWKTRKQAKDALHAHISGRGTREVCKGGLDRRRLSESATDTATD